MSDTPAATHIVNLDEARRYHCIVKTKVIITRPLARRPTGNVTPCVVSVERHGRVKPRTPIPSSDRALLTLDPSANRLPINLAEYVSLLPRKEDGNLYTNQIRTTEV
jgi:hypothetical protein